MANFFFGGGVPGDTALKWGADLSGNAKFHAYRCHCRRDICNPTQKQELSYRKQIARQLRTQYVEGIYRPKYHTVTLKSRLRVTQGQWKRNRWTDHTRLT